MSFKKKEFAIICSILMVASAFLLLHAPAANAEPFQGNEPSPTNVTFYFHNLSTPVTIGSSASLHIANTLNDTSPQYYKTGSNVSTTHYLTLSFSLYLSVIKGMCLAVFHNKFCIYRRKAHVDLNVYGCISPIQCTICVLVVVRCVIRCI